MGKWLRGLGAIAVGVLGASTLGGCAGGDAPWDSTSQSIEVSCGSFFEGSTVFRAQRSELSADQLKLLESLRTTDGNNQCWEDTRGCDVAITDGSGASHKYYATDGDATCNQGGDFIAYDTLSPFLETIPCQYGKSEGNDALAADARCLNGMFSPSNGTTVHQPLAIDEANRTYHIELDHCTEPNRLGQISMQLEVDGQIVQGVAPKAPGPDQTCLGLDFTPTKTGNLDLVITTSPSFLPAGDYELLFR